ncbi:hypothetical protein [Streptomyces rugosispiralis]|nr:hypothetical protein [Streptomyces rugosispiralis]
MTGYQRAYATGRWTVWANPPPAHVWHLQHPQTETADRPAEAVGEARQ